MPTYQYQCTECGNGLEVVQKFSDEALTVCPNCQGRLRKVFSAVGVVFKGSGFYRTDSRSSSSSSVSSSGTGGPGSTSAAPAAPAAPAASSSASASTSSAGTASTAG
ncbi:FmdB family transcriptional regulator [Streptomyces tateyamensis]|uniref:FmdB family transcriptional regulator n=1 Tax=Streptomyces tateyamensis TaxID=565073 RepID=A0A2V4NDQ2_9ACTN|nr:FmdB family zinc ribbon protein [Streptomyces tateyamensis]PYC82667.1 FmdB family transcriptional regulator [Streptomyces tateyamensis]